MDDDGILLEHELADHQFTEPLPELPAPPLLQRLIARTKGLVWFRVGYTCPCVVKCLTAAEQLMLLKGHLQKKLDIYQLQGGAASSAGTHSLGACFDIGQDSDAQIEDLRLCGTTAQVRYKAQGFAIQHVHGFPHTCTHGSAAQKAQQVQWDNRQNGLISHGPVEGRWPVKKWPDALKEQGRKIMALKDELVDAVLKAMPAKVWGWDGIASPDPVDPKNPKWAPASYLRFGYNLLARTGREIAALKDELVAAKARDAAQDKQLAAILTELRKPKP